MAKFKVGDKVRILDGSKIKGYSGGWIDNMRNSIGKIGTIMEFRDFDDGTTAYHLTGYLHCYDERGLELVRENKFKVGDIVVGNDKADMNYGVTKKGVKCKVICVCDDDDFIKVEVAEGAFRGCEYYVSSECFDLVQSEEITIKRYGNKVVAKYGGKVGVAKCSPEDEFDFETGAKLAFERLMGIEEKPTFTKDDLKTGMFVMTNTGKLGVVVNDSILYQEGGFDWVSQLNNELEYKFYKIDFVVKTTAFGYARYAIEHNDNSKIVWRRSTK